MLHTRPFQISDAQAVANIYNPHILAQNCTMEQRLHTAKDILQWHDCFNAQECLLVLEKQQQVIGWAIIKRYSERAGYQFTGETAVYLAKEEVGKGYGTLLKKALLKKCKALGYHHLVAKIWAINQVSIQYNLKLGYEIVGTQKEIGWVNGQWIDVVILQRMLD